MSDRGIVRALLDGDDRLLHVDEPLAALNGRAGGSLGEPLALAPLATLVRLTRRLGVLIARRVTVAEGEADLSLWIRAEPQDGGVALAMVDWQVRAAWKPLPVLGAASAPPGDWGWETDAALRLTALSPEAGARHGFEVRTLLGRPLTQLFRLGEDEGGDLPILAALALRRDFDGQRATVRASGRAVLLAATARVDPLGGFAGYAGAARAGVETGEGGLSHAFTGRLDRALRRPLGQIVANADSIHAQTDGPLRQDYVDYAADIASAGRHLIGLIDDLVDLQAVERPDFRIEPEPLDLADVARRAAGLLQVRAAESGVRIERPAPGQALPATGEFRRALQVLVNLIGNAVRYSPRGGEVSVRAFRGDGVAGVVVGDRGKGVAEEDQARIFEKFERVDRSEPGGNGLGLYIARRLARAMGGELTVESAPGDGARFTFTLPAE